jgi:MOSC domain-containing protein YiiM
MNSTAAGTSVTVPVMASARIVSVNAGREVEASWAGTLGRTAISKRPLRGPAQVGLLGLDDDEQADKAHHGGTEQAIYAYAREDLDWWAARLGRELPSGQFGENITTVGVDVTGAVVGEVWRLGDVVLQVTSPRVPCTVFRNWMDERGWVKTFREAGRPGAYLRVLRPGLLAAGEEIERISRPVDSVSVADALEAFYRRDVDMVRLMIAVPGHSRKLDDLPEEWLSARLSGTKARAAG